MRRPTFVRALEALALIQKGKPYSLRPEDPKRRLVGDLARLCRDLRFPPIVIGGLAVNHHGYRRFTADVDVLVAREDAVPLYRRLKSEAGWRRHAEGFKNPVLGVSVDIRVEGERTAPQILEYEYITLGRWRSSLRRRTPSGRAAGPRLGQSPVSDSCARRGASEATTAPNTTEAQEAVARLSACAS